MDLMGYFEQICAKLVQLSPITMIAGTYDVITIYLMDVNGIYKAVNITGGPQVVIQGALGVISVKTSKGTLIVVIAGHVGPSVHKGFVGSTVWHGTST